MFSLGLDTAKVEKIHGQFEAEIESCNMCGPYRVFLMLDKILQKNEVTDSRKVQIQPGA